jgi:hypothetical protein
MTNLYEILVPTIYGDTLKPIRTKHHKEWDKQILKITGGLTILAAGKGKWVHEGVEYPEKVLPVRILCTKEQILDIIELTIKHYRQKAVLAYKVSDETYLVYAKT